MTLSVIVPSVNGWVDLERCLLALERSIVGVEAEIIVVDRVGSRIRERLEARPAVRAVPVASSCTIPEMRRIGVDASCGSWIAVIEDHVIVPEGWAPTLIASLEHANATAPTAIDGPVVNGATATLVDRAAFLCEYHQGLEKRADGATTWLTGNNTGYPRMALLRAYTTTPLTAWENVIHESLRSHDVRLHHDSRLPVLHHKHYSVGEYASQRYLYSRAFAGARASGRPASWRVAYALMAAALPLLILLRIARRATSAREYRSTMLMGMPLLVLFCTAWALGEAHGALRGPGDALERVC